MDLAADSDKDKNKYVQVLLWVEEGSSAKLAIEKEIAVMLQEKASHEECNGILDWCRKYMKVLPILSTVTPWFLSVQASSAASERTFSYASHIILARRSRLHAGTLHKLSFWHANRELLVSKLLVS